MKNNIFKKASGFILAAVILLLMACGIPVRADAEEAAAETSGTLGNVTWEITYDETNKKTTLHISGEGGIPTLDELGIESYPWSKYNTLYITIDEGITSIPLNFCGASYVFIAAPMSMERISSGAFYGSIKQGTMTIYSDDCVFEENSFNVFFNGYFKNFTIAAYNSSTAMEFAVEQGFGCTSLGDAVYGDYKHDGVTYILHEEYAAVSHYTGNAESIKILSEIEGLPVTKINDNVFSGCNSLTSVTIPDSVTTIGSGIFEGCTSLKSIILSESIDKIGSNMFCNCTSLTNIVIPESVKIVGENAFKNCSSLERSVISENVFWIKSGAFQDCSSLKYVNLPDGITDISAYTFFGCTSLTEIDIPDSVEKIYEYAFSGSGLVSVELPENLIMVYEFAFNECDDLEEIIITEGLDELDYKIIKNVPAEKIKCSHEIDIIAYEHTFLASSGDSREAVVPECITIMYADTYVNYNSLTIGKKLKRFIVPEFESSLSYLSEVIISEENPYMCCEDGVIYNKDKTEIIYVLPYYRFENGIMTIPASVKTISCNLTNIYVESFVVEDGNTEYSAENGVLYDFSKKKLIAYPNGRSNSIYNILSGTETISKGAFFKADSHLNILNVPSSVNKIESKALYCAGIDYVIFEHEADDMIDIASDFEKDDDSGSNNNVTGALFYAHEESVIESQFPKKFNSLDFSASGVYDENFTWEIAGLDLIISGTGEISASEDNGYPWDTYMYINLKFNGNDIKISDQAFTEIDYIYTIDFSGVTEIGDYAFYCCKNLNKISGHEEVVMVGDSAFNGTCWISDTIDNVYIKILGSVLVRYLGTSEIAEIPENVTSVTANAFQNNKCKTLFIPDNNIFFHSRAFSGTSIEHVRYKGMEEDITLDELREAASLCEEKTFIDSAGNSVTGLAVGKENGLASLVNALSSSPFLESMYDEYCYDIIKICSEGMSDKQLITVLYNYTNNNVKYGFVYAEDSNGEYKNGDVSYESSTGLSHRPTGIVVFDRGVCSSYAELVNKYTSLIREQGLSSTLESVERYGLDHVWNVIGLDTGTENEKWYYLDLSNRTYLIGYENGILTSNPEMFAYDPELTENDDGTYTVTLTSGKEINIQSADAELVTVKGDVNGDGRVMIDDATAVLAIYAETAAGIDVTGNTAAADIDGNGSIDITDATAILTYYAQYSAGMNPDWNEMLYEDALDVPVIDYAANYIDNFSLTWTADSDADGYEVYRINETDGSTVLVGAASGADNTSWIDYSIPAEGEVYYYVRSYMTRDGVTYFSDNSEAVYAFSPDAYLNSAYLEPHDKFVCYDQSTDPDSTEIMYSFTLKDADKATLDAFAAEHFTDEMTRYEKLLYTAEWIHDNVSYAYAGEKWNTIASKSLVDAVFNYKLGQCLQYNGALIGMMAYMGYDVNLVFQKNGSWQHFTGRVHINGKTYGVEAGNWQDGMWTSILEPLE